MRTYLFNFYVRMHMVIMGCLCCLLIPSSPACANNDKIIEVTHKMAEIQSMQNRVKLRSDKATDIRNALNQKMRSYIEEVIAEHQHLNTTAFKSVVQKPRIQFDLNLIGKLSAYIHVLDQKIAYFESGQERMVYLYQQAEDDLKLIETLNDMHVDDLISRIDSLLAEYINELQNELIHFAELPQYSPEKVWKEYIAANLGSRQPKK